MSFITLQTLHNIGYITLHYKHYIILQYITLHFKVQTPLHQLYKIQPTGPAGRLATQQVGYDPKRKISCSGANCSNTHHIVSMMAPHEFSVIYWWQQRMSFIVLPRTGLTDVKHNDVTDESSQHWQQVKWSNHFFYIPMDLTMSIVLTCNIFGFVDMLGSLDFSFFSLFQLCIVKIFRLFIWLSQAQDNVKQCRGNMSNKCDDISQI